MKGNWISQSLFRSRDISLLLCSYEISLVLLFPIYFFLKCRVLYLCLRVTAEKMHSLLAGVGGFNS